MLEVILYSTIAIVVLTIYWWNENKSKWRSPTNKANWIPNHSVLPQIDISKDDVLISNMRNTRYSAPYSDDSYTPQYINKDFNLSEITTAQMHFSRKFFIITHVFVSFHLDCGTVFVVSVKPRRRTNMSKIRLLSILNPPEIIYTVATLRDVYTWRTRHLHERILSYNITLAPPQLESLCRRLLQDATNSAIVPSFYSVVSHNCFTSIFNAINAVQLDALPAHHWSYTFSPWIDDMLLKRGVIDKL